MREIADHLHGLDNGSGDAEIFYHAAGVIEEQDADIGALNNAAADAVSEAAQYRSLLVRIDHTVSVHGHMDADTELHRLIRSALALEESDAKLDDDFGAA